MINMDTKRYNWQNMDEKIFQQIWQIIRETQKNQVPQRLIVDFIKEEVGCSYKRALDMLHLLEKKRTQTP